MNESFYYQICMEFLFSSKKSEVSHNLIEIHYYVDESNYSFNHIISSFAYLSYHAIILMFVLYVFNFNNF